MSHTTVYLKATDTCNLNCSHCFTSGSSVPKYFWNVPKTKAWIDGYASNTSTATTVHFELHGGEVMLAPLNELREIVDYIREVFGPRASVGTTTNLVYKLTEDKRDFLFGLDGLATSWDASIRFKNYKQEELWLNNLNEILEAGKKVRLNISLSKDVLAIPPQVLLTWVKSLNVDSLALEPITVSDYTQKNEGVVPTNKERSDWFLKMHHVTKHMNAREWFFNSALEEIYAKFEKMNPATGTYCRDCEENMFTINADGTIGGCPNTASTQHYANIELPITELLMSEGRMERIANEKQRNDACYSCSVFQYCGSGCHQLSWEGDVCPSPKALMMELAGKNRKIIPIRESR